MKNTVAKWIMFLFLGLVLPGLAMAAQINPPHGNTWDLYVYGSGTAIAQIFEAIKLLMVPDVGRSGFQGLILLMATIGFIVLAIAAGFDPGKNLIRMFTYIIVVWGVSFTSTELTANIRINDLASATEITATERVVTGVPAIVALPASLTSEIGNYFTKSIETYFTLPGGGDYSTFGVSNGQFNLFGRMMQESQQYVITSPELKRSLMAYVSDCVVPAMALGQLMGPAQDPTNGTSITASGTTAITHSTNLLETLKSANSKAVLTKYFPTNRDTAWLGLAGMGDATGLDAASASPSEMMSNGVLMTCFTAYALVEADISTHAAALLTSATDSWSKAGVLVPLATAYSTMLSQVAAPGGAGGTASPTSHIMQQSFINSMNGSFRQAAIQTGNNELMQAAAVSQAELQQKSTWSTSFQMFNNMMGYVFTVLQAFIFALTPIVVVALFIPGMGKSIFTNYAQILVWLTLWQPMLAIINFIITLFGTQSLSMPSGFTLANKMLVSEKTNDLVTAAQFLGTMAPLISWGIVKGAMAFTEFISAGVGSQFASQAGAAAASGNLSMNNMSMDNTSLNKYNTMMSSAVGTQSVMAGANAGAMGIHQDLGGSTAAQNGKNIESGTAGSEQLSKSISSQKAVSDALSEMQGKSYSMSTLQSMAAGKGVDSAHQRAAALALSYAQSASTGDRSGTTATNATSASTSDSGKISTSRDDAQRLAAGLGADAKLGGKAGVPGVGAKIDASRSKGLTEQNAAEQAANRQQQATLATAVARGDLSAADAFAINRQGTESNSSSSTRRSSKDASHSEGTTVNEAIQAAKSATDSVISTLQRAESYQKSFGYAGGMSVERFQDMKAALDGFNSSAPTATELGAQQAKLESAMTSTYGSVENKVETKQRQNEAQLAAYQHGAGSLAPGGTGAPMPAGTDPKAKIEEIRGKINATADVTERRVTQEDLKARGQIKRSAGGTEGNFADLAFSDTKGKTSKFNK
jgi:hypothetical protein